VEQFSIDMFYHGLKPSEIENMSIPQLKHYDGYFHIIQKALKPKPGKHG
jgi:hypothetical protein